MCPLEAVPDFVEVGPPLVGAGGEDVADLAGGGLVGKEVSVVVDKDGWGRVKGGEGRVRG